VEDVAGLPGVSTTACRSGSRLAILQRYCTAETRIGLGCMLTDAAPLPHHHACTCVHWLIT
jgi:hypothetical protein